MSIRRKYGGVEVKLHAFLSSTLDGDELTSRPGRFAPEG